MKLLAALNGWNASQSTNRSAPVGHSSQAATAGGKRYVRLATFAQRWTAEVVVRA